MASNSLHHPFKNDHPSAATPLVTSSSKSRKQNAKRALRSLAIAVTLPFLLTMVITLLFGSGHKYRVLTKPFWFPPLWFIHLASLGSSSLMGLAAWLVWAEGGFHEHSNALPLYVAQVSLSIIWDPLVLVIGALWLGFLFCVVHFGTLVACHRSFWRVNPFAADCIKPCLLWMGFLAIVNFKMISL